jgi:SSS family solute:Na+ symporter
MLPVDFAIVIAFLAGLLVLGVLMYRWVGQPDDFYVAGRQLPPFILAATLAAANENLYGFVGQAGSCYKYGLSVIWHSWTGCMALVFSGLFVLPIFRRFRIRTIPEYLGIRYSVHIRILVGILWIFRYAFWLGVILYTSVIIARVITGIEYYFP